MTEINRVLENIGNVPKQKMERPNTKKGVYNGKYSLHNTIQELEALEASSMEELLKGVQTLEVSLQDLPSIEGYLAEVEWLTELMERELEEYLNE